MFQDFQGKHAVTIDQKGRMALPVKLRPAFVETAGNFLTLTRHPQGCLLVLPRPSWLVKKQTILQWPMNALAWRRMFIGNASDIEIDDNGRVLIPGELRKPVGLEKDVVLMGMGDHLELWDEATLTKQEGELAAAGVPDSIGNLPF